MLEEGVRDWLETGTCPGESGSGGLSRSLDGFALCCQLAWVCPQQHCLLLAQATMGIQTAEICHQWVNSFRINADS